MEYWGFKRNTLNIHIQFLNNHIKIKLRKSVIIPSEESPATSAAGGGLERTQWELLPLVRLGNLTAWPDAPYCSQGRGGSDGGLR